MDTRRSLLRRIASAMLLLCLYAAVGEITVRIAYPLMGGQRLAMWRYGALFMKAQPDAKLPVLQRPNVDADLCGVPVKTNSMGFRDAEYAHEKPAGKKRILILGDELVFGWGLPLEETIPKRVEQSLNAGGNEFEVINMGVCNYNSAMDVDLFRRVGLDLNPDVVVVVCSLDDTEPTPHTHRAFPDIRRYSYVGAFLFDCYATERPRYDREYRRRDYCASLYQDANPGKAENRAALKALADLCQAHGIKPVFINYPDLSGINVHPDPFQEATNYFGQIATECDVPFLDLRNYFACHQRSYLQSSIDNPRGNIMASRIAALAVTKAIRASVTSGTCSWEDATPVRLSNEILEADLLAGQSWRAPIISSSLSGLKRLFAKAYEERNIFFPESGGCNFEHVLNGALADDWRNWFTPRIDDCRIETGTDGSVSLLWPQERASWPMDNRMRYALRGSGIDLDFSVSFQKTDCFPHDWVSMMWASYVVCRGPRAIHFWGAEDRWDMGWIAGSPEWRGNWNRSFIFPYVDTPDLPFDPNLDCLNIASDPHRAFLLPFYYGHVDGDGDPATTNDDMAYVVMFDQAESIRFQNCMFQEDKGRSAWDWQFVVRNPKTAQPYGYRARIVYKPFVSEADIAGQYVQWVKGLEKPAHSLDIKTLPENSASVFPPQTPGMYGDGITAYFGVVANPGWVFDHWEGNVKRPTDSFTSAAMQQDETVTAVCRCNEISPSWQRSPTGWSTVWNEDFAGGQAGRCEPGEYWHVIQDDGRPQLEAVTEYVPSSLEFKSRSYADFRAEMNLDILDGTCRVSLHGTTYSIWFGRSATFLLTSEQGGPVRKLASGNPIPRNQWCTIDVMVIGGDLKVALDGQPLLSWTTSVALGKCGVGLTADFASQIRAKDLREETPVFRP